MKLSKKIIKNHKYDVEYLPSNDAVVKNPVKITSDICKKMTGAAHAVELSLLNHLNAQIQTPSGNRRPFIDSAKLST